MNLYRHNDATDAMIRAAYASPDYKMKRARPVLTLAERLGWPKHAIRNRAIKLGIVRPQKKEPPWSEAEMEVLESHAARSPKIIQAHLKRAGFSRSESAIVLRRKRYLDGFTQARMDAGLYTGHQVGELLGVNAKTVAGWVAKGWLKAGRKGTQRVNEQGTDHFEIKEADIREFIIGYTAHIRLDRMEQNKFWLVDLLTGRSGEKQ